MPPCNTLDEWKIAHDTDRELWRAALDDPRAPRVFITLDGELGLVVGGRTIVLTVERWHELALKTQ